MPGPRQFETDEDEIFLINTTSKAPHAYRDLNGEMKFDGKIIQICRADQKDVVKFFSYFALNGLQKKNNGVTSSKFLDRADRNHSARNLFSWKRGCFLNRWDWTQRLLFKGWQKKVLKLFFALTKKKFDLDKGLRKTLFN